ncbi:PepSY domain-containing protein [Paucibacter sp. M5-1]|uniref:PepSY domain-containing protein n=1 Tax=Paucibacter sp. M5-1 TaxID=3015998 RepID=UPI0022B8ED27|nr:PepSY domain-containing protein [Paucibacter sp. M5-1]MCZ7882670.1 PepSY domain-containing protein [Paucibacter sp. M5-1]
MRLKRWLYLLHRWAGIALCLVMALWFLSGMVMMYVGYPKLTPAEQLQGLAPLPAQGCCVPLEQALQAAGLDKAPTQWRLSSVAGAPRYLFSDARGKTVVAVDARSGARITGVDEAQAVAAAAHFAGDAAARSLGPVQEDAWTHSRALDAHRPLHRVAVDDGRWLYISGVSGEVVRDASLTERTWGWLGAWLHWLYLFRGGALNAWWTDIVIWLSLAGGMLGLSGLVVGIWRWRFKGRYKSGSRSPYRGRMARWHHILGLLGGTLALSWVISGLLSMNPWKVFEVQGLKPDRQAYAGGPLQAGAAPPADLVLARLAARGFEARLLEWRRIGGAHYVWAQSASSARLLDARGEVVPGLDEASLVTAARAMLPGAPLLQRQWLRGYDAHYYAREAHTMTGQRERPLPALRLMFGDALAHHIVLDPASGAVLQVSNSRQRLERWLFAFAHSFDLPQLLALRPLWDGWMLIFSLAGLGLSLTGVVMGWRRLRRSPAQAPGQQA